MTIAQLDPNLIRPRASAGSSETWPDAIDIIIAKINEILTDGFVGEITGSGTAGKLPKFATATTLADSLLSETGVTVTLTGGKLKISNNTAGNTSNLPLIDTLGSGATFNTVGGNRNFYGVYASAEGSKTNVGGFPLDCIGIFASASGGDVNWAGYFDDGDVFIENMLEVNGALNHDGTTVGFYAATPVVKATGIAALTDNTSGTANDTLQAITDPADGPITADALRDDLVANTLPAIRNDFADLAAKVNALRTVLLNLGLLGA